MKNNGNIPAAQHPSSESSGGGRAPKALDLKAHITNPFLRRLATLMEGPIERALALNKWNELYDNIVRAGQETSFFQRCITDMRIRYSVSGEDVLKIPAKGPLVIVANHPFGCIEGVILGALMNEIRADTKALGNYLLQEMEELREWVIPVDVFGGGTAAARNLKGIKQAVKWVRNGGALITFPAGVVAHFQLKHRTVTDPAWSRHIAAIIRLARASALPIFFPGRNSLLFQVLGLIHPVLRTVLIPREMMNKRSRTISLYVGKPVSWKKLEACGDYEAMMAHLRVSTYFLQNRISKSRKRFLPFAVDVTKQRKHEPVAHPPPGSLLADEVRSLPESCKLVNTEDYAVYIAGTAAIPNILREIGRLRELTFREVGEGTGKSLDTDRFDNHYLHLFLWNKAGEELAGAYRLGLMDVILREHGGSGLYTSTLFRFKPGLFRKLGNAIELGRSFIRSEYQKEYSCLSLLWRGIGEFVARNPTYSILFGPVSISNDYHAVSKNLLIQFLRQHKSDPELSRYVRPRKPYRYRKGMAFGRQPFPSSVRDVDDISLLISEIEKDSRGIPILLRHYLKLNATILSFSEDKHFSNVVDGLIVIDLTKTDARLLKRFMGQAGFEIFTRHHEISPDPELFRLAHIAGLTQAPVPAADRVD